MQNTQAKLILYYKNWDRPQHQGLFDYREQEMLLSELGEIKTSGILYRHRVSYQLVYIGHKLLRTFDNLTKNYEILLQIKKYGDQYKITDSHNQKQPLSFIAPICTKMQDNSGLLLSQGNIVKIGKVTFKIMKIKTNNKAFKSQIYQQALQLQGIKYISEQFYVSQETNIEDINKFQQQEQKYEKYEKQYKKQKEEKQYKLQKQQKQQKQQKYGQENSLQEICGLKKLDTDYSMVEKNPCCRFCYSKTITTDNNFMICCMCQGSTKYIHERCLAEWIYMRSDIQSTKIHKNKASYNIYKGNYKGFQCQICQTQYQIEDILKLICKKFTEKTKFEPLQCPEQYLFLKFITEQKKMFTIIDLKVNEEIKIGRELTCDIFLDQLSVSRTHCLIKYDREKNQLRISDMGSKFGTVVKKSSIIVNSGHVLKLQKGRTVLEIKEKKKKIGFFKRLFCNIDLTE